LCNSRPAGRPLAGPLAGAWAWRERLVARLAAA